MGRGHSKMIFAHCTRLRFDLEREIRRDPFAPEHFLNNQPTGRLHLNRVGSPF